MDQVQNLTLYYVPMLKIVQQKIYNCGYKLEKYNPPPKIPEKVK